MKPNEARVLIIDDDTDKRGRLAEFVSSLGGEVVGEIDTRGEAHRAIGADDFPHNTGNPNVVWIDGNLDKHGRHGTDGKYIFNGGFKEGRLHRVDNQETLGAVALGCSRDGKSDVKFATGDNVYPRAYDDEDDSVERWTKLLEPHPANPDWIEQGILERVGWDRFGFGEMLCHLVGNDAEVEDVEITVISGKIVDSRGTDTDEPETRERILEPNSTLSLSEFIGVGEKWAFADDSGRIKVGDKHKVEAVIKTGEHHIVVTHNGRVAMDRWTDSAQMNNGGMSDKIRSDALDKLPESFLASTGITLA